MALKTLTQHAYARHTVSTPGATHESIYEIRIEGNLHGSVPLGSGEIAMKRHALFSQRMRRVTVQNTGREEVVAEPVLFDQFAGGKEETPETM